jgi:hypothetical protein
VSSRNVFWYGALLYERVGCQEGNSGVLELLRIRQWLRWFLDMYVSTRQLENPLTFTTEISVSKNRVHVQCLSD